MWIMVLGWPVEPVEPVEPVKIGKMSDNIFYGPTGERTNGLNLLDNLSLLSLDINQKWMQKISYGKHSKHNIDDSAFQWSAR